METLIWMVTIFLAVAGSVAFYMLPSLVAAHRQHKHAIPIAVLNLLTGWSFVGWVVALVWACMPSE